VLVGTFHGEKVRAIFSSMCYIEVVRFQPLLYCLGLIVIQGQLTKTRSFRLLVIVASAFSIVCSDVASAQTFVDRQSADSFRLACYNVHFDDLFEPAGIAELTRFINAVNADVYAFQELFFTSSTHVRNLFNQIAPLSNRSWQVHKGRNQVIVSRYDLSLQNTDVPGGTRGIAMAQVNLPDEHFSNDMYILNNHFPCCDNESQRVTESIAIVNWMADALTVGGNVNLALDTAVAVVGDLNTVRGPVPRDNLLHGIGSLKTDWDGSSMTDANPSHNATEIEDYTWRDDTSPFPPGILDYVMYTDSVISVEYSFILNPSTMTNAELAATGLIATDMMRAKNISLGNFDHLPLIVDFAANLATEPLVGDVNLDGVVDFSDIPPFIELLSSRSYLFTADMNFDGVVDFSDIPPFIFVLTNQ